jgi:crossover junction endodeoxyribonuclease RuvC
MKLLALDISSTNIGYVVWTGDMVDLAGTIVLKSPILMRRLIAAQPQIEALIEQVQPDAVAYEGPAHRTSALSMVAQQRMVGVALLSAGLRRIEAIEIAPASAKKALTGNGHAKKEQMMFHAGQLVGVQIDEHQADALGVALAAWPGLIQRKRAA